MIVQASVLAVMLVACGGSIESRSGDEATPTRGQATCGSAVQARGSIQFEPDLLADVQRMLRRSVTFRAQCRRMAESARLRVMVRRNPGFVEQSFRARSHIQRARSGLILVLVEITAFGSPVEWIAHEFEHVLEQLDGVPLRDLAGSRGVWRSAENMFETERAIRAGRLVADEMKLPVPVVDILVE